MHINNSGSLQKAGSLAFGLPPENTILRMRPRVKPHNYDNRRTIE